MAEETKRKRRPRPPEGAPIPPTIPAPREINTFRATQVRGVLMAGLLAGKRLAEIEREHAFSRTITKQLLADPEFRADLEEARSDVLRAVRDRTGREALKSLETLAAIRDNHRATWASRVRAADRILRLAFGTPAIEMTQTTVVMGQGGPDPAEQLRTFLGKLQQRGDTMAQALPAAPIDVESTET